MLLGTPRLKAHFFPKFDNQSEGARLKHDPNCVDAKCLAVTKKHSGHLVMAPPFYSKNGCANRYSRMGALLLRAHFVAVFPGAGDERFAAWWAHAEENGLCYSFECVVPRILGDHGATPEAAYMVLTCISHTGSGGTFLSPAQLLKLATVWRLPVNEVTFVPWAHAGAVEDALHAARWTMLDADASALLAGQGVQQRFLSHVYAHRVTLKAYNYNGYRQLQVDVGDDQIFFGWKMHIALGGVAPLYRGMVVQYDGFEPPPLDVVMATADAHAWGADVALSKAVPPTSLPGARVLGIAKLKCLNYLMRTFGVRNVLPMLIDRGAAAYVAATERFLKIWGVPTEHHERLRTTFSQWAREVALLGAAVASSDDERVRGGKFDSVLASLLQKHELVGYDKNVPNADGLAKFFKVLGSVENEHRIAVRVIPVVPAYLDHDIAWARVGARTASHHALNIHTIAGGESEAYNVFKNIFFDACTAFQPQAAQLPGAIVSDAFWRYILAKAKPFAADLPSARAGEKRSGPGSTTERRVAFWEVSAIDGLPAALQFKLQQEIYHVTDTASLVGCAPRDAAEVLRALRSGDLSPEWDVTSIGPTTPAEVFAQVRIVS
ncbi:RNA ligase [Chrysochromulina tobinii]|uniref:RNA ligase n=1 Tax=Chrysochromulina tobinii TaxID=1460289 RepID=A0A0M0J5C0_9EUKA|nr:RNA ligase [Chrysochromulina tobinii]|eukprot:KOO21502.1 RNA ligase [Chrysochromulina sp. CCMP291]